MVVQNKCVPDGALYGLALELTKKEHVKTFSLRFWCDKLKISMMGGGAYYRA